MIFQLTLLIGLLIIWVLKKVQKPEKFPPSPPRWPYFGSYFYTLKPGSKRPNLFFAVTEFAKKYGSIFGFWINQNAFVVLTDFEDIKEVMKLEAIAGRSPGEPSNRLRPGWESMTKFDPEINKGRQPGVIGGNGKYWREQRRFLLRNLRDFGFGKSSMEDSIQVEVQKLCVYLETKINEPFDLNRITNVSILNALWFILVGERLELTDPKLLELMSGIDNILRGGGGSSSIAALLPHPAMAMWPGIKKLTGFDKSMKVFQDMQDFIKPYLEEHKKELDLDDAKDFMDLMLQEVAKATDSNSSFFGEIGHSAIFNNMIDLFLAGMETTSSALLWTFLYLLHHPEIQSRVHDELDRVVGKDKLPSLDDKPQLHFINAVLHESLRFTSFIPMSVPHYALDDVKVKEYVIPKGSIVLPSLYHVMHNPKRFKNPSDFNPDRFIHDGIFEPDEQVIPFGIGKRYCLGQSLAEKEYFLFFTGLMQKFRFDTVKGQSAPPSYRFEDVNVKGIMRNVPAYKVNLVKRQ